jgi:hypothetical protein
MNCQLAFFKIIGMAFDQIEDFKSLTNANLELYCPPDVKAPSASFKYMKVSRRYEYEPPNIPEDRQRRDHEL